MFFCLKQTSKSYQVLDFDSLTIPSAQSNEEEELGAVVG